MNIRAVLVVIALATGGCAGAPPVKVDPVFSGPWRDDGGTSMAAVRKRLAQARVPEGAAVAIGVTKTGLAGARLDGTGKWRDATRVDARPAVVGDVVVATGGGRLFALDARSGKRLWSVPSRGRALLGAGDDGKVTVATLGTRTAAGHGVFLAIDRSGKVLRELSPGVELGVPAVLEGIAFVPWDGRHVSALEIASGKEIARLAVRESVSHALAIGDALYFGESTLLRFDGAIAGAGRGHRLSLPVRDLPGSPQLLPDGKLLTPAAATVRSRIQLYARPALAGDRVAPQSGRFAATYFRVVLGLDAENGVLRWVRTLDQDVFGGVAADGGFALCEASGRVSLLDANGTDAGSAQLGEAVDGCVVQAGTLQIRPGKPPPTLTDQIVQALNESNADMVAMQRFLLRELGALPDPKVTKVLIDLATNATSAPALLQDARALLGARRSGKEYMLKALADHYDFLDDVLRPPPVGPLADALSAMGAKEAAPLLARHLNDPANTPDDVERAARALAQLATTKELDELRTFFSLYRATADQQELVNAVISAARALLAVGGDAERQLVERAAEDPLTHPDVKRGLLPLVQHLDRAAIGSPGG
jgi:outer membrane protein assembly factor BamB